MARTTSTKIEAVAKALACPVETKDAVHPLPQAPHAHPKPRAGAPTPPSVKVHMRRAAQAALVRNASGGSATHIKVEHCMAEVQEDGPLTEQQEAQRLQLEERLQRLEETMQRLLEEGQVLVKGMERLVLKEELRVLEENMQSWQGVKERVQQLERIVRDREEQMTEAIIATVKALSGN